jgi:hypothetical protein
MSPVDNDFEIVLMSLRDSTRGFGAVAIGNNRRGSYLGERQKAKESLLV